MKNIIKTALVCFCITILHSSLAAQDVPADTTLSGIYNYVKSATDAQRMDTMTEMFLAKTGSGTDSRADQCCKYVAVAYACEGNLEKTIYWLGKCRDKSTIQMGVSSVMKELLKADQLKLAEQFLRSDIVTQAALEKDKLDALRGELLFQQGNFAGAVPLLKAAYERSGANASIYATALLKSGQSEQVFDEVDRIVRKQLYMSDEFKETAKAAYQKKFGDARRLTGILDSTMLVQRREMEQKVAKMAIDQPAPDFELTDLQGRTVSLKSLRGKTIFIDFWATWCGPCVYSFPGMQKAVDYYKQDTSVVFLFVHSYERVPNATEEVKRYIHDKKYRFNVYMDLASVVAKKFNVTHLPTKLVIDKNGIIKVRGVGLIMEDRAVAEIQSMIELSGK